MIGFVAADHENQTAIGGADFRSGHGSVDVGHAFGANAFGKFHGGGRRNGAGIGDDHALGERLVDAICAKQYLFDGGGVGNAEPYHFGSLCGRERSWSDASAFHEFTGSAIPNCNFMTGLGQIRSHGLPHNSQTQESNSHL